MPNLTGKPLTDKEKDDLLERWSKAVTAIRKSAEKLGMVLSFRGTDVKDTAGLQSKNWGLEYVLSDKDANVITSGTLVELEEFLERCPKLKAFL